MVPPPRHHATVVLASLLTPRDHLPVGIRHLGAARPRRIVSSPGHGRRRRSTVDRTAGGSARNARVAHRRQRAADPRFRGRDKSTSEARIGRPLTPMSYAGVARRTTSRAVYGTAAAATVAGAAYYAPRPGCTQVTNAYGQVITRCQ